MKGEILDRSPDRERAVGRTYRVGTSGHVDPNDSRRMTGRGGAVHREWGVLGATADAPSTGRIVPT